jgi:hypothetical protein
VEYADCIAIVNPFFPPEHAMDNIGASFGNRELTKQEKPGLGQKIPHGLAVRPAANLL